MKEQLTASEKEFVRHEQMYKAIDYILKHLQDKITVDDLCKKSGYSRDYFAKLFKKYYGQSWERFITMLRMRQAANEIRQEGELSVIKLAEKYRFSGPNAFSKAFRREIGLSPRNFKNSRKEVPEMPWPETINGKRLFRHYINTDDKRVLGRVIVPCKQINNEKMLSDCAYPLEHCRELFKFKGPVDQVGFWWGDAENERNYVLGHVVQSDREKQTSDKLREFVIPGTGYVRFSVEISDSLEETLLTHRAMVYYVMKVWQTINHKVGNWMQITYEEFTQNYTRLWLPLFEGMAEEEMLDSRAGRGISSFIPYIDQHLTRDLSIEDMAAYYNYSVRHLRRTFVDNIKIPLAEFIKKRRLCRAAEEMYELQDEREFAEIAKKYQFRSLKAFQNQFTDTFRTTPENYLAVSSEIYDPEEYMSEYRDLVLVEYQYIEELHMIGTILHMKEQDKETQENIPVPELASYWMLHDSDKLKGTRYECTIPGKQDKIGLWIDDLESGKHEYILGPAVESFEDIPEGFFPVTISAGRYAVFESNQESDEENLTDVYYMLKQFSVYEWFRKGNNMTAHYNGSKKSFIRYFNRKLHYYIPVYH